MSNASRIWVVDDDQEDQMMLNEYFSEIGLEGKVDYFDHGRKMLDVLEKTDDDNYPKLIVLDLNMPILNGSQTLLEVKRDPRFREIPVIIFSTSENSEEKRKCLSFGALDYLVKPMSFDEGQVIVKQFASFLEN